MNFSNEFKPQSLASTHVPAYAKEALDCIDEHSPLGKTLEKAKEQLRLQTILEESLVQIGLESLINQVHASEYRTASSDWLLLALSPAISHRLQQKLPSLIGALKKHLPHLQNLHVKLAPQLKASAASSVNPQLAATPAELPSSAMAAWQKLYEHIKDDPTQDALRMAIERLIAHQTTKK
jgi:hypothetical protein